MNLNSILKTGGSVDVLIRTAAGQQIGDRFYTANEPYTLLKDVNIEFYSQQQGAEGKSNGNILSHNEDRLDRVVISNVPLSSKIINLVFNKREKSLKTNYIYSIAEENSIILQHNNAKNIFVYKQNELVYQAPQAASKIITNDVFVNGEKYLVFYEYTNNSEKQYDFTSPAMPYFALDIFGVGNSNNAPTEVFLKILNCSLKTDNSLSFDDGLNTVDLTFVIIKEDRFHKNNYLIID